MLRTHDTLSLKMSLYLGLQVLVTVMDIQYLATDKHDHVYMSVHFNILQLTKNGKKKTPVGMNPCALLYLFISKQIVRL